jgi:hypothetical protein
LLRASWSLWCLDLYKIDVLINTLIAKTQL